VSEPAWAVHLPLGTDPAAVDVLAEGTLPRAWARRLATDPDRPVLFEARRGWVRAGELDEASRRVAARLHRAGLRSGDRVLMSAATSLELVEAHVAALRVGLVVVPANTAYREREMTHLVTDSTPGAAVLDDPERAGWVRRASGGRTLVIGPEVDLPDGPPVEVDQAAATDPALLCYTSGTTGSPKGAVLSHANVLASAESVRLAWRWTSEDRLVLALPLFHFHGLGVGLHGTLLAGASAVLLPRFDPDSVLDAAAGHGATLFFGVPTMYARLAGSPRLHELSRLRLCVSGSAPLAPNLFERIWAGSGQRLLERYGTTESGMNVSSPHDGERRPGAVGFPLPGVELRLDDGGEILVRGPSVFSGYWENPAATEAAFADQGWFRTGDIGELDGDGYLRIVGRAKELIITGGLNVYPREVEEVLATHPAVAEVAVAGLPDDEWGEVVTAFVVPAGASPDPSDILAHAAGQLAAFKRPRAVRFVESLPRNALGKILRHELT
jgi:malonyl-CoA/methylmalonyl-CoA synthetase